MLYALSARRLAFELSTTPTGLVAGDPPAVSAFTVYTTPHRATHTSSHLSDFGLRGAAGAADSVF